MAEWVQISTAIFHNLGKKPSKKSKGYNNSKVRTKSEMACLKTHIGVMIRCPQTFGYKVYYRNIFPGTVNFVVLHSKYTCVVDAVVHSFISLQSCDRMLWYLLVWLYCMLPLIFSCHYSISMRCSCCSRFDFLRILLLNSCYNLIDITKIRNGNQETNLADKAKG